MTAESGSQKYTIPLDPPMASLAEARPRVIQMDTDSIKALGRSSITVKEYRAPQGFGAVVFLAVLATFILLSRAEHAYPGSFIYDNILRHVPALAALVQRIRVLLLAAMLVIHGAEVYLLAGTLAKHSMPLFSRTWWLWLGNVFFEGFTTFQR
jgi:hypothetical protein